MRIDANAKKVQHHKMGNGTPAVSRADMSAGEVTAIARVTGLYAATDSTMSVQPPQEATGNGTKVVQRQPVRMDMDPADLREHPEMSGRLLAASARTEPVPGDLVSQAPAVDFAPVEATISGIIRDNALPGVCPVQGKP
jgi:Multidrug resistance efflux pump